MTTEKQPFEDVSPIKHGDFPLPCVSFQGCNTTVLSTYGYTSWDDEPATPIWWFLTSLSIRGSEQNLGFDKSPMILRHIYHISVQSYL